jgi:hypothetical protein
MDNLFFFINVLLGKIVEDVVSVISGYPASLFA